MTTKKPAPKPLPSPVLTGDMKHEPTPPAKIAEAFAPKAARCRVCKNPVVNRCAVCGHEAK
ncbi:MAG: hypothetical protein NTV51_04030 [Verrucomicrobia bacterium]|nr:hypothetical protein [Verrucomicrobiota bacterium]